MPSQAVKRISIRWLPEPAYEDTDTIALNVGGYFIDLRVTKEDHTIQWSRAGERIMLKQSPPTFRWTHIIDSLDLSVPDDAYFEKLPNGDDLEIGTTPCPHKGGAPTDYEEMWRDITSKSSPSETSWIIQSKDGMIFIGKVGGIYLAIQKCAGRSFAARREDRHVSSASWEVSFESGDVSRLPRAFQVVEVLEKTSQTWAINQEITINGGDYVFRGFSYD
ncbi:hypothetical protein CcaCcLH18_06577 [Colletotrichum camelliae]|nr:hypothetical protein CcaCcLH18_06577 [Colletotrichum camelliae]